MSRRSVLLCCALLLTALVAQRLRAAARMAAQDAKVREVIQNSGSPILYQDTPDFEKYVQADVRRMVDVVKRIGKVE